MGVTQTPALSIVKTADPVTVTAAGDSVDYSFVVTNTGNVTVTDVTVTDTFTAPAGPELTVTCPDTTLAPAASTTCTASYTVTQADVDNGSIVNSAVADGLDPTGTPVPTSDPSTATVTATPAPGLSIVKTADPTTVTAAGDTVAYSFVVTNTGNMAIANIDLVDDVIGDITCPKTWLASNEQMTCTTTAIAVVGQSRNVGTVTGNAVVPGTDPSATNPTVTQEGDYIFRVCFTDTFQGAALANFATTCCNQFKCRQRVARRTATLRKHVCDGVFTYFQVGVFNNPTHMFFKIV